MSYHTYPPPPPPPPPGPTPPGPTPPGPTPPGPSPSPGSFSSALSVEVPFPVFYDRAGEPLENGYIFIGQANLNPQTNPIQAYFDRNLTQPAAQPLRTLAGYISNAGTPAQVYVDASNFSILVQDKNGTMVYNFPDGTGIGPDACAVDYNPPGGVPTTVCVKLAETISVKDFGAVGDGVTDDSAAFQNALNTGKDVFVPPGTYQVNMSIGDAGGGLWGQKISGTGRATVLRPAIQNTPIITVVSGSHHNVIERLTFQNFGTLPGDNAANNAIRALGCTLLTIDNCFLLGGFTYQIYFADTGYALIQNNYCFEASKAIVRMIGGSWHRIVDNVMFMNGESPTENKEAIIYITDNPSVHIARNYLSRGRAPAIYAIATPPPGGFSNNLIQIYDNDIDNVYNWGIRITGYWNVHIFENWISAANLYPGDTIATGGIYLEDCQILYITNNDFWQGGSTGVGLEFDQGSKGLYLRNCAAGTITGNIVQYFYYCFYNFGGSSLQFVNNIFGEQTGLDLKGTVPRYGFFNDGVNQAANVNFINNLQVGNIILAAYGAIDTQTILRPKTYATDVSTGNAYLYEKDLTIGNLTVVQNLPRNVNLRQVTDSVFGRIRGGSSDTDSGLIEFSGEGIGIDNCSISFYGRNGASQIKGLVVDVNGNTVPGANNAFNLGNASFRWAEVFAINGTINTSDVREKQDIESLDDVEKRVAQKIKGLVKKYRFIDAVNKKGDDARIHVGVVAQEVKEAFESEALDPEKYSMFCHDIWYEYNGKPVPVDKNQMFKKPIYKVDGEVVEANEDGAYPEGVVIDHELVPTQKHDLMGVRYNEMFAFVISAM